MNKKIFLLLTPFIFAILFCGASAAAVNHTNATSTSNGSVCTADPIINGTVTITEYGKVRPLKGAKITINSTANRILATATTDDNGYYSTNFYSTDASFKVTVNYLGCPTLTQTVTPAPINVSDPNYYATANFNLVPKNATLAATGNGQSVYVGKAGAYEFAGIIRVTVDGVSYNSFCIDLYTPIAVGDTLLVNGPLPGTTTRNISSQIDWGKVNYIITRYNPSTNLEASAMQCAIWYFTSVQYGAYPGNDSSHSGYYQFLTFTGNATTPADGVLSGGSTIVRDRAWQMINNATSIQYPYNISISPEMMRLANGVVADLTLLVTDIYGNPVRNITVNLAETGSGSLNATTVTTDAQGKAYVKFTPHKKNDKNKTVNIIASVAGTYGTLLYDDKDNPKQNLVALDVLPYTLSAVSIINYDVTADVALSQNVSKALANVGESITFVVKATNVDTIAATGIMIQDIIPPGLSNVVATPSVGTFYNGIWTIPTLNSGVSAYLTITGIVNSNIAGLNTTNIATRIAQDQYNSLANSTSATFYTKMADVVLSQTVNSPVNVGDNVTYIIRISNIGPDDATNFVIQDIIPNGLLNAVVTPSTGTYSNGNWTVPFLANGDFATLTITGLASASMAGKNTTNTATKIFETEYDPTTIGESVSADAYTKEANVVLSQTGSYNKNNVTFIVTARNNGPDTATEINISDVIPAGLSNVIVIPSVGTYSNGVWYIPALANGSSAILNITGSAFSQKTTLNIAKKTNQVEYDPNEIDITTLGVYIPLIDITVTNSGWYYLTAEKKYQDSFVVGNTPVFMWGVRNSAIYDEATGVVSEYIIPKGFQYVGSSCSTGTITYSYDAVNQQGILTWIIGYMPRNGTANTYVTLRVAQVGNKSVDLTPVARLKNVDQNDVNSGNDQNKTCGIIGQPCVDIQVNQSYEIFESNGKNYVTYTVVAANNGLSNATGVQITDKLPVGLIYMNHTISNDGGSTWTVNSTDYNPSSTSGVWNIGNFDYGTGTRILKITAEITATNGTIINTATRTGRIEKDYDYNNDGQTTYLTITGNYTRNVDITVTNSGWYYLTAEKKYQDSFVVGNTPVFMWGVRNSAIYDEATGVVSEYIIPKGFQYVGSSCSTGTITYSYDAVNQQGILTWIIGYMPRNGTANTYVTLRVAQVGNKSVDLTPVARLKNVDQNDVNSGNDQNKTCGIIGQPCVDIQVNQSYEIFESNGKNYVTYTVVAANNGLSNATGVQITDKLPVGLIYMNHTISNDGGSTWTVNSTDYNPSSTSGVWNIGNFDYGTGTRILKITAEITATNGTIINTATRTGRIEKDYDYNNDGQTTHIIRY